MSYTPSGVGDDVVRLYNLSLKLNGGKYLWGVENNISKLVGVSRERVRQIIDRRIGIVKKVQTRRFARKSA